MDVVSHGQFWQNLGKPLGEPPDSLFDLNVSISSKSKISKFKMISILPSYSSSLIKR